MNETAWRAGLSHTMILRMERGDRLPTIDTLLRITDALEVDLAALLAEAVQAVRPACPARPVRRQTRKKTAR